jgi:hypothetical protein
MSKKGKTQRERERERESLLKVVKGRVFQILLTPMCKHWDQYNTDCVSGFVPILGLLGFLRPEKTFAYYLSTRLPCSSEQQFILGQTVCECRW